MFKYNYNYNPKDLKDFSYNANIITQYNDINDDDYYNYYHDIAFFLAVQIDQNNITDFESYVKNNYVSIPREEAIKYIHNKTKGDQQ